eukprot:4151916-Amphidinium_carterae.3
MQSHRCNMFTAPPQLHPLKNLTFVPCVVELDVDPDSFRNILAEIQLHLHGTQLWNASSRSWACGFLPKCSGDKSGCSVSPSSPNLCNVVARTLAWISS